MTETITVCARVRPPSAEEGERRTCLRVIPNSQTVLLEGAPPRAFAFDYVADRSATQEDVFAAVGMPPADACLDGYNATVFAYGQTGSGKSYTMIGSGKDTSAGGLAGIAPRTLKYIFSKMSANKRGIDPFSDETLEYVCKCTMLEIYNEQITDLLVEHQTPLQLREDTHRGVYVEGLSDVTVATWEEAFNVLKKGEKMRSVGETAMNARSSRSHCVFTIIITSRRKGKNGVMSTKHSRLNLVDLAGSERQKSTSAAGQRLKEAGQINKSLTFLANVIRALSEMSSGKEKHIQYRDSKLTLLLKDSLGGNSKTTVVATLSPAESSYSETLSTLMFASRAKMIKTRAVVNEEVAGNTRQLQEEVQKLRAEIERLKSGVPPTASSEAVTEEASKIAEEDLMKMNLMLLMAQERNSEVVTDRDSLRVKVRTLQESIGRKDRNIAQLQMLLKLKDAVTRGTSTELESLRAENMELRGTFFTQMEFDRIKLEHFLLKDAEERRNRLPPEELETKNAELNTYLRDLEGKYHVLWQKVAPLQQAMKEIQNEIPQSPPPAKKFRPMDEPTPPPPVVSEPAATPMKSPMNMIIMSPQFKSSRRGSSKPQADAKVLASLREENGTLNLKLDEMTAKAEQLESKSSELAEERDTAQSELALLKQVREEDRQKIENLTKQLRESEEALAAMAKGMPSEQSIEELKTQLKEQTRLNTEKSEQNAVLEQRIKSLDEALVKSKEDADKEKQEMEKHVQQLRTELFVVKEEKRELIEKCTMLEERLETNEEHITDVSIIPVDFGMEGDNLVIDETMDKTDSPND